MPVVCQARCLMMLTRCVSDSPLLQGLSLDGHSPGKRAPGEMGSEAGRGVCRRAGGAPRWQENGPGVVPPVCLGRGSR